MLIYHYAEWQQQFSSAPSVRRVLKTILFGFSESQVNGEK